MPHLTTRSRLARLATAVTTSALAIGLLVATPAQGEPLPPVPVPVPAPFGPDISRWQHPFGAPIDWAAVRASGSSFVIIKATEGSAYTSPYFADDAAAARANGLAVGAYHYARPALPMSTAFDQAQRFAATLGTVQTPATLPPILDLETTGGLTPGQLVTWAQVFTETLRATTGRTPVVYTYVSFWNVQMAGSQAFTRSPLWLAFYRSTPPPRVGGWPAWTIWQYTASATLPGIVGNVDMNRFAGDSAAFAAFVDGTVATPWAINAPLAPVRVKATAGVRSASVRWVPSDDGGQLPSSYTVTASPGGAQVSAAGTSPTADFTGLTEGTTYTFTVTATNTAGTSASSPATAPVTARGDVPEVPTGVVASVGRGSVALAWSPGALPAGSYVVTRCSPAPCQPTTVVASVPAAATSYVDTAVVGGVTYGYAVASTNRWGSSLPSPLAQAMPLPTVDQLAAPTGLVATATPGRLTVAWRPVPFAARYQVLRCAGTDCVPTGAPVATLDIPTARLSESVPAGSTFTYTVQAVAGQILSAPSLPVTGTALIPQSLRVSLSPANPKAGQRTTVTVRLVRTDTRAALAGRRVSLALAPARGRAPASLNLLTSATGEARVVITPQVSGTLAARSAARDLLTVRTRALVRVKPVLAATLSAAVVQRGTRVRLSGRTSPLFVGERVVRQLRVRSTWRTVATATIGRGGQYGFTVAAAGKPGTQAIRLYVGATPRHLSGASPQVTLTAR